MAFALALTAASPDIRPAIEPEVVTSPPRTWRFAATLRRGEVLVVRGMRRGHGRIVLETEEILAGTPAETGFQVRVCSLGTATWHIIEPAIEQHLADLQLEHWAPRPHELQAAFAPPPGVNGRRYTLQWVARVEWWEVVRKRHPALPALSMPGGRVHFVRYAGLESTTGAVSRRC